MRKSPSFSALAAAVVCTLLILPANVAAEDDVEYEETFETIQVCEKSNGLGLPDAVASLLDSVNEVPASLCVEVKASAYVICYDAWTSTRICNVSVFLDNQAWSPTKVDGALNVAWGTSNEVVRSGSCSWALSDRFSTSQKEETPLVDQVNELLEERAQGCEVNDMPVDALGTSFEPGTSGCTQTLNGGRYAPRFTTLEAQNNPNEELLNGVPAAIGLKIDVGNMKICSDGTYDVELLVQRTQ